jgi:hypothetical protein
MWKIKSRLPVNSFDAIYQVSILITKQLTKTTFVSKGLQIVI